MVAFECLLSDAPNLVFVFAEEHLACAVEHLLIAAFDFHLSAKKNQLRKSANKMVNNQHVHKNLSDAGDCNRNAQLRVDARRCNYDRHRIETHSMYNINHFVCNQ